MKKVQKALLVLLRAGLWESRIEDLSCFPMSAGEWKNLYLLSRQQTVTGIVFQGIQHLPEHFTGDKTKCERTKCECEASVTANQ